MEKKPNYYTYFSIEFGKINFPNFFFRYCCSSDILSLNGSTGPPTKFQSLNDTALTSIYGQTYGKIVLQFFDTILWEIKVKKKFGTPPVPVPTPHQFFPVMLLFLYKCLEAVCHMLYLYEIEEEIFFDDSNETHSKLTDEKPCGRSLSSSFYF